MLLSMKQFFILILLSIQFLALPSLAQTLKPGLWKAKITFKVNDISMPSSNEEDCILPHEVKDVKASIEKNLKKNDCSLTKWTVKGHKLDSALSCNSDNLVATGTLRGDFSDKSYKLNGEAKGTIDAILPATATIELRGEWVKPCIK